MKQSEMLAVLKVLSSDLLRCAAGSDSIVPGAYAEALNAAIETLDRMTWISVKDRLPEENTPVLICTQWRDVWMASYYSECRIAQKLFSPAHWDVETLRGGGIDCKATDVTHWMPLPELPKGENNG